MKTALIQLNSSDDPAENLSATLASIQAATAAGARFVLTPEVTNCVLTSRSHQSTVLQTEPKDRTLAGLREAAVRLGIWILIGSLALKTKDTDGRFANRSFLIDSSGEIQARYDKIHMFDVSVSETEAYRESASYRPGKQAVLAQTPFGNIGMTICYDLRFPALYRKLTQAGAQILTVPSAFSPVTGAAHWEVLLRSRAIECSAYVLAPAQTGEHRMSSGRPRATYGHGMAIDPWGTVIACNGVAPGVALVDLDLTSVEHARSRIPSLAHDRIYNGP